MLVTLTVPKFREYNPRPDVKHASWVRLSCRTPSERKLFKASVLTKWVWVTVLCVIGEEGREDGVLQCELDWISDLVGDESAPVLKSLEDLSARGLLALDIDEHMGPVTSRNAHVTDTVRDVSHPYLTDGRTDGREGAIKSPPTPPKKTAKKGKSKSERTEFDNCLAADWATHAISITPHLKPDTAKWADAIRQLREIDKLSEDHLRALFEFVKTDEFWRVNALSPVGLRKDGKNGLPKHVTIWNQARSRGGLTGTPKPVSLFATYGLNPDGSQQ